MGSKTILHFLAATLTFLTLFWSVGSGHMMANGSSMPHNNLSTCQTACPPLLNEKPKTPQFDEDKADPNSLPFTPPPPVLSQTTTYLVLFGALTLLYLQRRPPDKLALNSIYLN